MHSSRIMCTARGSSHPCLGGLPWCMLGYTHPGVGLETPLGVGLEAPPGVGLETPLARPLNFPLGVGLETPPGDLQCMLGYHPPGDLL